MFPRRFPSSAVLRRLAHLRLARFTSNDCRLSFIICMGFQTRSPLLSFAQVP